jgi:flagellar protein FliO/FliZ
MKANAALHVVGSLSLGGRERILVVEIGDQWIVVGAAPGRVSALATMARQDSAPADILMQQNGLAAPSFSEWLKQTIEKRNGK